MDPELLPGSGSAWIQNFCLDPDPELGKFRFGSGTRKINHSGPTTLSKKHSFVALFVDGQYSSNKFSDQDF